MNIRGNVARRHDQRPARSRWGVSEAKGAAEVLGSIADILTNISNEFAIVCMTLGPSLLFNLSKVRAHKRLRRLCLNRARCRVLL